MGDARAAAAGRKEKGEGRRIGRGAEQSSRLIQAAAAKQNQILILILFSSII
jgi:hypothetical protein